MNETAIKINKASQIAYHVGFYERAWRTNDSAAMHKHFQALETLCADDTESSILRAACVTAAALTRPVPANLRDQDVSHLASSRGRENLIRQYLEPEPENLLAAELAAA